MLIGILVMYFNTGATLSERSFDMGAMLDSGAQMSEGLRHLVWFLLLVGFATKMPSVPVHTWLPDAHVQAPTAGSMILAGVMLKMGAYGFLRVAVTAFPASTVVCSCRSWSSWGWRASPTGRGFAWDRPT